MGGLVLEMGIFLESHLLGEIYVLSGATSVSMPEVEQGSWPLALFTQKECYAKKKSRWLRTPSVAKTALPGFKSSLNCMCPLTIYVSEHS